MRADRSNTVVVGVDGSRASLAALTAALADAAKVRREVEVVTVWAAPSPLHARDGGLFLSRAARRRALRVQTMATAVATRRAGVRVPVTGVLLDGDPAEILVQASAGAAELVLGAPRSGTRDGGPTASVLRRCLTEARCPVRVMPADELAPVVREQIHPVRRTLGQDGPAVRRASDRSAGDSPTASLPATRSGRFSGSVSCPVVGVPPGSA
jgi:nucleotide-binding universal stress UspA family protein